MPITEHRARTWAAAGLFGIVGLALLHAWTPAGDAASSICLLRRVFHLPCPGCGMTRAFAALAKGDWRAAVSLHPLAPVVAAELVLGWAAWGLALASRRPVRLPGRLDGLLLANLAALVALWLGRVATGTLPW
ncbi:MAG TPA: DUF2752 domain-containing protein [Thermoanaerobaculia bacterium]|nr:DUF2752 domain-containing protein [Thermoanaerobaculia bacterium]